ncbi:MULTISPECIES: M14 family metallopeptidase [Paenibacillus]|uniref:LysM peptidoglycan-binding domain-containing protein n=1 Tax=Paenibacillus campinasensis TaxID=66347 RepID=A0A268F0I5_9BACL|nr:M14 family metallopeptidase [Paenibacillus campinasensis]MUG65591.1 LysM peptidoglycan-binding domain-containing protein [Paenibacillus campinasensis]PAD78882.1 peptidase M14 [Paenibacillus campinasensis]
MQQYIVQKGDTLTRIAARFGLAEEQLLIANPWAARQPYLHRGQMLYLPASLRRRYVIQQGDSLESIAETFRFSKEALKELNPGLSDQGLREGKVIVLPSSDVSHTITLAGEYGPAQLVQDMERLSTLYPFIEWSEIGTSVLGKAIYAAKIGKGDRHLHINAALHANEWITAPCLLRFAEDYARSLHEGSGLYGHNTGAWYSEYTLWLVPMANPDGVELVQEGAGPEHPLHEQLLVWNGGRQDFRRWKANVNGVDLGDQFPAYWEEEVKRRGRQEPAPQDYGGPSPLSEPEAQALYQHTLAISPVRAISLHSQGREIYWNYRDAEPPESEAWATRLGQAGGYRPVKLTGSDAGYKDWFIQHFRRPGFTIEIGYGVNPLPLEDFEDLCVETGAILAAFMALE